MNVFFVVVLVVVGHDRRDVYYYDHADNVYGLRCHHLRTANRHLVLAYFRIHRRDAFDSRAVVSLQDYDRRWKC